MLAGSVVLSCRERYNRGMTASSSSHMPVSLSRFLTSQDCPAEMSRLIHSLSDAALNIAAHIAQIGLSSTQMGAATGDMNSDGDQQKQLDVIADEHVLLAAQQSDSVSFYYSEERDEAIACTDGAPYLLACDPLDGSSNIENNLTIGTIFSISKMADSLPQGRHQRAAGFFAYGPQTTLILSCGQGVYAFAPDRQGQWQMLNWQIKIPPASSEFAINASNQRHWPQHITSYMNACLAGIDGGGAQNYNMRWLGSLVGDAFRIFRRGGIFLYPEDSRAGYQQGRLRIIYEAYPIAFLVEQAGGRATDGLRDILDIPAQTLHQRIPLIFGSADEVDKLARLTQMDKQ